MNPAPQIVSELEALRTAVGAAAMGWDAANLPHIEAAAIALEASLQPLRATLEIPQIIPPFSAEKLRISARSLRQETAALECLVDAASAFIRGIPCGANDMTGAYTSAGEISAGTVAPMESYAG
ncbi:MAG TPA: hypothetical protein VG273_25480 [Bryobacteraceae bacterium]|jgi:hypothetical protein|nr:hypothetical protein [Bryobacteraceae bacterium]